MPSMSTTGGLVRIPITWSILYTRNTPFLVGIDHASWRLAPYLRRTPVECSQQQHCASQRCLIARVCSCTSRIIIARSGTRVGSNLTARFANVPLFGSGYLFLTTTNMDPSHGPVVYIHLYPMSYYALTKTAVIATAIWDGKVCFDGHPVSRSLVGLECGADGLRPGAKLWRASHSAALLQRALQRSTMASRS